MKWMIRTGAVLGLLVVGLGLALLGTAHRSEAPDWAARSVRPC